MRRLKTLKTLKKLGSLLGTLGGALALTGALLPWAHLSVFGWELSLPGVLWSAGAGVIGLALLGLLCLSRAPLLACLAGMLCFGVGWRGRADATRDVVRRQLELRRTLAPVNARLEQATLAPIEPFGAGVRRTGEYGGIGGAVALWGAALLTLGGAARFAGQRERRRCEGCRTVWPLSRLESLRFCPACGVARFPGRHCARCGEPLAPGDKFCLRCGAGT